MKIGSDRVWTGFGKVQGGDPELGGGKIRPIKTIYGPKIGQKNGKNWFHPILLSKPE